MNSLIYISFGLLLGIVIGWMLRTLRTPAPDTRIEEELRRQIADREMVLAQLRGELTSAREARASAEAARHAAEENSLRAAAQNQELLGLQQENGRLQAELKNANHQIEIERQQIQSLQEKFSKEFQAVSNQLLINTSQQFKEQSAEKLNDLLAPLKTTLSEVKTSLETTRKETATHSELLKDQISRIGTEAANLSKALKGDVKLLGNWGENILDKLLEASGLKRDTHYRRQVPVRDKENNSRVIDVIIDLPEGRNIIIDSKVSLNSYEQWMNCPEETQRADFLSAHSKAIRNHFERLGEKEYHDCVGINSPDWVLMYIPIEGAYSAAVTADQSIFTDALNRKVILATNSSLLAALRTVHHVWSIQEQEKNALRIAEAGGKLYDKFVGFVEDLELIGRGLGNARDAYEDAMKKLRDGRGNLTRQAQQLRDLGAKAKKALPAHLADDSDGGEPAPPTSTALVDPSRRLLAAELPLGGTAETGL